jgi:hypothetical protein
MRHALRDLVLAGLLLAGCAPKTPVVTAPQPMDVAVVAMVAPETGKAVQGAPDAIHKRIDKQLSARKLTARPVAPAAFAEALAARRVTSRRLAWTVEHADGAPLVLLVETAAFPFAQVEGRNRWTVEVSLSIARADAPADAATTSFSVPVILQFLHEKEDRAVEEAATVIERKLSRLLDDYLGGLETGS